MAVDPIPIFIAERSAMNSQLLAESLGRDPRFEVSAVIPAPKILSLVPPRKPGVAVISAELDSEPTRGMHLARSIRARTHDLGIVILLESLEREKVIASFRSGAKGVFCRTDPLSELRSCIERVSQGRIWTGRTETEYLLEAIQSAPTCDGLGDLTILTKREIAVAEMAAQGLSNKQIAQELGISEHTVKNHLFRIFEKLEVANRIELLFLMVKACDFQYEESARRFLSERSPGEAAVVAAAENGFPSAQFMLGMAHLEGKGFEKDDRAAYHWLRMAETNAVRVLEETRHGIHELKSRLTAQQIQELEQQISQKVQGQHKPKLKAARGELQPENASNSKLAC
jgi:two-component system, NarL family, nitrate/nitrite response regulator NarL